MVKSMIGVLMPRSDAFDFQDCQQLIQLKLMHMKQEVVLI